MIIAFTAEFLAVARDALVCENPPCLPGHVNLSCSNVEIGLIAVL